MGDIGPGFSFGLHRPFDLRGTVRTGGVRRLLRFCLAFRTVCGCRLPSGDREHPGDRCRQRRTCVHVDDRRALAANSTKNRIIFGSTSEHQLAVVAKALIADYYGSPPSYSTSMGAQTAGEKHSWRRSGIRTTSTGFWPGHRETSGRSSWARSRVGTFGSTPGAGVRLLTTEKLPALHAAVVRACGKGRGYVLDPAPAFSPRRGSSAGARTAIPASRRRRSESRPCSTAAPRTRPDRPCIPVASPTV